MQHSAIPAGSIHPAHNWAFASAVEREALTGATIEDIGKLAWQQNDGSLWILTSISPLTWVSVGGVNYSLPVASPTTLGGVKVGDRLSITDGVLSADVQSGGGGSYGGSYGGSITITEEITQSFSIGVNTRTFDVTLSTNSIQGASFTDNTTINLPAGVYLITGVVAGRSGGINFVYVSINDIPSTLHSIKQYGSPTSYYKINLYGTIVLSELSSIKIEQECTSTGSSENYITIAHTMQIWIIKIA